MTHYLLADCERSAPDIKVNVANMGPIWGRQDPVGPHVGPINLDIWHFILITASYL